MDSFIKKVNETETAENIEDKLSAVKTVRKLTYLDASSTSLKNVGGKWIGLLSASLQYLNLSFNPGITDWEFLSKLTALTSLDVSLNSSFDDSCCKWVGASLTDLISLNLTKTEIGDNGLPKLLYKLDNLIILNLSKTGIGDEAMAKWLAGNGREKLKELHLQYTQVGEQVAMALRGCSKLQVLKVTGCPPFGDKALLNLTKLEVEEDTNVGNVILFPKLASLDIGGDGITDGGVINIGTLNMLKNFGIWNTKVSPKGAGMVKKLTGLVMNDSMRTTKGTYLFCRA